MHRKLILQVVGKNTSSGRNNMKGEDTIPAELRDTKGNVFINDITVFKASCMTQTLMCTDGYQLLYMHRVCSLNSNPQSSDYKATMQPNESQCYKNFPQNSVILANCLSLSCQMMPSSTKQRN